jgi:tRNA (cytidine/uridine-2'-O-)-methyltransferase
VRRAGLDYWPRVQPRVWSDWPAFAAELPALGAPFFFTARATRAYHDVAYPDRTVLIFGRESVGLSDAILTAHAADTVGIPMLDPEIRSLNLSTSVALAAYEVRRQRGWQRRVTGPRG